MVTVTATASDSSNNELEYIVAAGEANGSAYTADSLSENVIGSVGHSGYYRVFSFYFDSTTPDIAIANGETFSINNASSSSYIEGYNIIIIPEAG